jgi:hypothetical protein
VTPCVSCKCATRLRQRPLRVTTLPLEYNGPALETLEYGLFRGFDVVVEVTHKFE